MTRLQLGMSIAAGLLVAFGTMLASQPAVGLSSRCDSRSGEVLVDVPGGAENARGNAPAFLIDTTEVTVSQFREFVDSQDYKTEAERLAWGTVFQPSTRLTGPSNWVRVSGADWRHPRGRGEPAASPQEPVTQVTYADALAYARWRGRDLPTDAEWERAAKGGDPDPGSSLKWAYSPAGAPLANTWQGLFPESNTKEDGFELVAPVGCFAPNSLGLHDMIGNVWELTHAGDGHPAIKGGSYLCSFNGCANFRPSAEIRGAGAIGAPHIGFRTIRRLPSASSHSRLTKAGLKQS